jgi:hypothetical protein
MVACKMMEDEHECDLVWSGSLLDMEKILEMMESCNKDCRNCTRDEKLDCILEMRESVHSLAKAFKSAILSQIEAGRELQEKGPPLPKKTPEGLFS